MTIATSWVGTANEPDSGFPLQSLPFCAFTSAPDATPHLGVGIGAFILDLHQLQSNNLLTTLPTDLQSACTATTLNALMRCGPAAWSALRQRLTDLLITIEPRCDRNTDQQRLVASLMLPAARAIFHKPVATENYTDFYASLHHATNVGKLFRPDAPLLPNYPWLPIGYHGRASSLVISGTSIRRPYGQIKLPTEPTPVFEPTNQLDYELEVAAYIGSGNPLGSRIPIANAPTHLFGLSLLNDWSARDIQSWEYQPLGPFLGKSFATSLSPWVIPIDALAPYRTPLAPRPTTNPAPLPYLTEPDHASGFDVTLEVLLSTSHMREHNLSPAPLSTSNLRDLYWSFAQMLTHHTSNGCNLQPGDILASGTVSGPNPGSAGCLLEITQRGTLPLQLPTGELREFLADGDEIILRGHCHREGLPTLSLGECRGTILPAA
ncbi:MAG TPA: fumarylacetoacetase [Acidobacteriaceae bacterium]|nr:fumarylacetoacetase [Acidobacteriaceae bacterium]